MENKLNNFLDQKRVELQKNRVIKISLKAITNAQKNLWHEFLPTEPPTIKIKVKAIPEKGKANLVIEKFVSKYFKANAEIIVGQTNSLKIIEIKK